MAEFVQDLTICLPKSALKKAYARVPGLDSGGKGCAGLYARAEVGYLRL
jgi:hypothetical protein